jgi:hypothetical protein
MKWGIGTINVTIEIRGLNQDDLELLRRAQELREHGDEVGDVIRQALLPLIEKYEPKVIRAPIRPRGSREQNGEAHPLAPPPSGLHN